MKKLLLVVALLACACTGRDYPDDVRAEFMNGCTGGKKAKEARCGCMLEGIEEAYTLGEFIRIEKEIVVPGKPWPNKMKEVALECEATT